MFAFLASLFLVKEGIFVTSLFENVKYFFFEEKTSLIKTSQFSEDLIFFLNEKHALTREYAHFARESGGSFVAIKTFSLSKKSDELEKYRRFFWIRKKRKIREGKKSIELGVRVLINLLL